MDLLNQTKDMCDLIEKNKVIKQPLSVSLFELQKQAFLNFVLYLALADGAYDPCDQDFIQNNLGMTVTKADALQFQKARNLDEAHFNTIPQTLKYFVLADAGRKIPSDPYHHGKARNLTLQYRKLGENYLAQTDHPGDKAVDLLTEYLIMMDRFLKDYGLLRPDAKTAPVDAGQPSEPEATPEELLAELNSMVGLRSVKEDVNRLVNLLKVQKMRQDLGLKSASVNKHMVFSGNPGSGKTTVARILAKIYRGIGVLQKGQLVEVDRSGLVSGYVGQTALKTQDVIDSAIGGVLFIDEAYTLTNEGGENDFGQEAVDTLLKAMEDHRDDLIVIVAGYTDQMEQFLNSNPGLKSRFNKMIVFEDYTAEEELQILKNMAKSQDYNFTFDALTTARYFFEERCENKPASFANARDVRNFLEKAITNQAERIMKNPDVQAEKELLTLIEAEDVIPIKL